MLPDEPRADVGRGLHRVLWAVALFIVAACAAVMALRHPQSRPSTSMADGDRGPTVRRPPTAGATRALTLAGYIVPHRQVEVSSKLLARVRRVMVEEGDQVRAGQLLASLEDAEESAQLAQAEADLRAARARQTAGATAADRALRLRSQGIVSERDGEAAGTELDVRRAETQLSEARVELARTRLADCAVVSPIAGVVTERLVEAGELVGPVPAASRNALFRVASLLDMRVEADVSESDVSRLRPGLAAEVQLDATPDRSYLGCLVRMHSSANRQKAAVKIEIAVIDADSAVRPDLSARVVFRGEVTCPIP